MSIIRHNRDEVTEADASAVLRCENQSGMRSSLLLL